jgi:putative ABC transport system permease protein
VRFLPLVLRNLGRNKLRTLLTGGAIGLAVLLVCFFLTMPAGIDVFLTQVASNVRISVHHKGGLVYQMPFAYVNKMRAVPGVVGANGVTWFGGAYEEEEHVSFPSFAIEPEHVAAVWPDYKIDAAALERFRSHRDGAIVGRQTMAKYRWHVGQEVALRSTVWPVSLTFRIVGEIPNDRSPLFWFQREYLAQAMEARGTSIDIVGLVWVRVADPALVDPVMARMDAMFRNSPAETSAETEKSFFASFFGSLQGFVTIILLVTALVALCVLFIAANTASMAVRERAREIAILRAIGFGRGVIFGTLVAESTILATVSGGSGALLTYAFTAGVKAATGGWSTQLGPLSGFLVSPAIVGQGVALAVAVGLVAGIAPAYGAARKPVAVTLREVF